MYNFNKYYKDSVKKVNDKMTTIGKNISEKGNNGFDKLPNSWQDQIEGKSYDYENYLIKKLDERIGVSPDNEKFKILINKPLKYSAKDKEIIREQNFISPEIIGTGTVTFADYFYNMSQIDPDVVSAIDFSRKNTEFRTFEDVRNFVKLNHESLSNTGSLQALKGFTGEQIVADYLRSQGHIVEFPNQINQEGYDLIVDGNKFQVKWVGEDSRAITEHFEKYPDIPVYTSMEMAEEYGDNPMVNTLPFSSDDALESGTDTVNSFDSIGDGSAMGIPVLTMCTSTYSAYKKVKSDSMSINEALKYVALDTVAVGGGGYAGATLGFEAGAMLAPATGGISVVIAPVIGGIVGAFAGRKIISLFRKSEVDEAYELLEYSLFSLANKIIDNKQLIRNNLRSTLRRQRMCFRKIITSSLVDETINMRIKNPSMNYILLREIAERYRLDSNLMWKNRKEISDKILLDYKIDDKNELQRVIPIIYQYKGAIELSSQVTKKFYEESLSAFQNYNKVKKKYE